EQFSGFIGIEEPSNEHAVDVLGPDGALKAQADNGYGHPFAAIDPTGGLVLFNPDPAHGAQPPLISAFDDAGKLRWSLPLAAALNPLAVGVDRQGSVLVLFAGAAGQLDA